MTLLSQRLAAAHDVTRTHLKKAACYQRCKYYHKATGDKYRVGDAVMMRIHTRRVGITPKLQQKFDGLYRVATVLTDVLVRIQKSRRQLGIRPKLYTRICSTNIMMGR